MSELDFSLPVIWALIIGTAVALYVVLDGFDLGIGILFPLFPDEQDRDQMMNSVAPFWDGNETWLVLGGGGLWVAFPKAFAVIMPALYLPVIVMLLALIFRGVAFEFRWVAKPHHRWWDIAFCGGSIVATFSQGLVLGGLLQGIEVRNGQFAGGPFDWLTPFSLLCGCALVTGYALIGATWLVMKTDTVRRGAARARSRKMLLILTIGVHRHRLDLDAAGVSADRRALVLDAGPSLPFAGSARNRAADAWLLVRPERKASAYSRSCAPCCCSCLRSRASSCRTFPTWCHRRSPCTTRPRTRTRWCSCWSAS